MTTSPAVEQHFVSCGLFCYYVAHAHKRTQSQLMVAKKCRMYQKPIRNTQWNLFPKKSTGSLEKNRKCSCESYFEMVNVIHMRVSCSSPMKVFILLYL